MYFFLVLGGLGANKEEKEAPGEEEAVNEDMDNQNFLFLSFFSLSPLSPTNATLQVSLRAIISSCSLPRI